MIGHNHLGKNGRFGNQMFQYAATRGIAAKHNYDWCIPDGPKTDEEFNDEENQHKLFMAFKMGGVKTINMHPAPYKQEGSFTFDQDLFDNCEDNINLSSEKKSCMFTQCGSSEKTITGKSLGNLDSASS